jgi:hypothetical protein
MGPIRKESSIKRVLFILLALTSPAGATTYYANSASPAGGNGLAPGTAWSTIAEVAAGLDALADDGADDTVECTGTFTGTIRDGVWEKARTGPLRLQATAGTKIIGVYTTMPINLTTATLTNINLILDGFEISVADPSPLPADDGNFHHNSNTVVYGEKAKNLQILNCEITGCPTSEYFVYQLASFTACEDVIIQGCTIHGSLMGVTFGASGDYTAQDNEIYNCKLAGGIRNVDNIYGTWVNHGNYIHDLNYARTDAYFPHNYDNITDWHPSAGIYVKSPAIGSSACTWTQGTISANKLYQTGTAECLYLHELYPHKQDLLIENNVVWDSSSLRFRGLEPSATHPVIIRNNTFATNVALAGCTRTTLPQRYGGGIAVTMGAGYTGDGTGLFYVNNLVIGRSTTDTNYWVEEYSGVYYKNNLFWGPGSGKVLAYETDNYWATWKSGTNLELQGNYNLWEWTGCTYTAGGFTPGDQADWHSIFVGGGFSGNSASEDYHLTEYAGQASVVGTTGYAIDHGDATYGATEDADGVARDALPDIGAYEYVSGGEPAGPIAQASSPSPADAAALVAVGAVLSWTADPLAVSHDVYFGTDATPDFIGNQPGTTYDPALTYGVTYYWRIDSRDADDNVVTGTVWRFTTKPRPWVLF